MASTIRSLGYAAMAASASLSAQVDWRDVSTHPPLLEQAATAFDASRGRLVVYGGRSPNAGWQRGTWEWDGDRWRRSGPFAVEPGVRVGARMVYDSVRQVCVLFGGRDDNNQPTNETWLYDGSAWSQWITRNSPPPRDRFGMAFDPVRGECVLFGGERSHDGTWVFDGTDWRLADRAGGPEPRHSLAMCWNGIHDTVLLTGGQTYTYSFPHGDAWQWDGTRWIGPRLAPSLIRDHQMVWDQRRRLVVTTGRDLQGRAWVWDWDGKDWIERVLHPSVPLGHQSGFDTRRGVTLGLGGRSGFGRDLWAFDGSSITFPQNSASPPPANGSALAAEASGDGLILFGGRTARALHNETWRWSGRPRRWTRQHPAASPPAGRNVGMAPALVGDGVLLVTSGSATTGTWRWDGSTWHQLRTQNAPAAAAPAMATDTRRQRIVLWGGGVLGDQTWEWDGVDWQFRPTTGGPDGTYAGSMTYDEQRGVCVLRTRRDRPTWLWDGVSWTRISGSLGVGSRSVFYDRARRRTGLASQGSSYDLLNDVWVRRSTDMPLFSDFASAWDPGLERLVLFGGSDRSDGESGTTVTYGPVDPATVTDYGAPCSGSSAPTLRAVDDSRPWLGTDLNVRVRGVLPGAVVAGWVGFSDSRFGPFALPLDLTSFGMAGCTMWASNDFGLGLSASGGQADWLLHIPNVPDTRGRSFYLQAAMTAPGANRLGIVVTNALACTIGGL